MRIEIRRLHGEMRSSICRAPPDRFAAYEVRRLEERGAFDDFAPHNDPCGERDSGALGLGGRRVFRRIDRYDRDERFGSPDPDGRRVTRRILAVMPAGEYRPRRAYLPAPRGAFLFSGSPTSPPGEPKASHTPRTS